MADSPIFPRWVIALSGAFAALLAATECYLHGGTVTFALLAAVGVIFWVSGFLTDRHVRDIRRAIGR